MVEGHRATYRLVLHVLGERFDRNRLVALDGGATVAVCENDVQRVNIAPAIASPHSRNMQTH